jgi:hypothetical protein
MRFVRVVPVMALLWGSPQEAVRPADCGDWQTCRQRALEAADKQDYDLFHDLAWRALRAGPRNDPALMTLVARAQSLSGRPQDALVMLRRLADMGVATDAATSEDFRRVRALPGWSDLEARLAGGNVTPGADVSKPVDSAARAAKPPPVEPPATKAEPPAKPEKGAPKAATASAPLSFSSTEIEPTGLAYDAVSGRFLVGDRAGRKLAVIGERSRRVANFAGVDGGLGDITAFEIDSREGDLWVVSSSAVHKLQLISGRLLASIPIAPELEGSRFTDVAIAPDGSVLVLDSEARRVFRVARRGRSLELVTRLAASEPVSVAPATDTIVYTAYDRGIIRIDLTSRLMSVVEPSRNVDLSRLTWLRWHRGSLVGIQKPADGPHRLVRIKLDASGRTASGLEVIADTGPVAGPTSATIAGNALHYVRTLQDSSDLTISRYVLK